MENDDNNDDNNDDDNDDNDNKMTMKHGNDDDNA
jgi:hypothetical protein